MTIDNRLKKDKRRLSEVHGHNGPLWGGHAVTEYRRNAKWGIERNRFQVSPASEYNITYNI